MVLGCDRAEEVPRMAVHFARFFPFPPRRCRPAKSGEAVQDRGDGERYVVEVRPLRRAPPPPRPAANVFVVLNGKILEEHFLSCLNFSWPWVACAADCSMRRSRVVFASFRDSGDHVQKFALRFPTSCEAQTFLDAVMDSSKGLTEIELTRSDLGSEMSSQSEHIMAHNQQK